MDKKKFEAIAGKRSDERIDYFKEGDVLNDAFFEGAMWAYDFIFKTALDPKPIDLSKMVHYPIEDEHMESITKQAINKADALINKIRKPIINT